MYQQLCTLISLETALCLPKVGLQMRNEISTEKEETIMKLKRWDNNWEVMVLPFWKNVDTGFREMVSLPLKTR